MFLLYTSVIISVIVSVCVVCHGLKTVRAQELAELQVSQDEVTGEKREEPVRVSEDALGALMKLGYKKKESTEALERAMKETRSSDNGLLVRAALKHL